MTVILVVLGLLLAMAIHDYRKIVKNEPVAKDVALLLRSIHKQFPEFYKPAHVAGQYVTERIIDIEFKKIPAFRKELKLHGVYLEEAPRGRRNRHSHQIRYMGNLIPVSNYIDVTESATEERVA